MIDETGWETKQTKWLYYLCSHLVKNALGYLQCSSFQKPCQSVAGKIYINRNKNKFEIFLMQMYRCTCSLEFVFQWQTQQGQTSLPNGPRIVLGLLQKKFEARRKISVWISCQLKISFTFQITELWRHRWAKNMKWTREEVRAGSSQPEEFFYHLE